ACRRSFSSCRLTLRLNCGKPLWMLKVRTCRLGMRSLWFASWPGLISSSGPFRQFEAEHVLRVVRDTGRVTPAPLREYFVLVLQAPVAEHINACVEAGFLAHLTHRGLLQR